MATDERHKLYSFAPPECAEHFPHEQTLDGESYVSCCLCGRALDGKVMPVRFWSESFAGLIKAAHKDLRNCSSCGSGPWHVSQGDPCPNCTGAD